MKTLRLLFNDTDSTKGILFCAAFIGLNIIDAYLTGIALGLGSYELNPFLRPTLGSSMLFKGLISATMVLALITFKQVRLLKLLNLGMLLICTWNSLAIWSWI